VKRGPHACLLGGVVDNAGEPIHALVNTLAGARGAALHEPLAAAEHLGQLELLLHLGNGHGLRHVLLVGEDEDRDAAEIVLVDEVFKLLARGLGLRIRNRARDAALIGAVDDEDKAIDALVVVAPERADDILAADVPHGEGDVLVLDSLDVEADRRHRGHDLAEVHPQRQRGLTGVVEAENEDLAVLLAGKSGPNAGKKVAHCASAAIKGQNQWVWRGEARREVSAGGPQPELLLIGGQSIDP